MPVVAIENAGQHVGAEVTVRGWLYNLRESGKLLFPIFRDGTGIMQGVISQKEYPKAFEAAKGLTQESSVIVTGTVRAEPRAPGGFELHVSGVEVVQIGIKRDRARHGARRAARAGRIRAARERRRSGHRWWRLLAARSNSELTANHHHADAGQVALGHALQRVRP